MNKLFALTKTDMPAKIPIIRFRLISQIGGAALVLISMIVSGQLALAQTSPDEHASHHPAETTPAPTASSSATTGTIPGVPVGTSGVPSPNASSSKSSPGMAGGMGNADGAGGMMSGMGDMMKGMMGGNQKQEFYPSLMSLPLLSSEHRIQLQQQAEARTKIGETLLEQGTARILNPSAHDVELREGLNDVRAGLKEMESGQSARRALAEGRPPREVALQWFQTEMNLATPNLHSEPYTIFGVTPFHLFTMALLIAFALAMVVMYFFKMRRAASLFGRLDSDSGSPPGASPPLGGTPDPLAPKDPQGGETPSSVEGTILPTSSPPFSPSTPHVENQTIPSDGNPLPPADQNADSVLISGHANELWKARGQPTGSPEIDWLQAESALVKAPVTANWRGRLRVGGIIKQTPSVKTFRLLPSSDYPFLPFTFKPGQFLNVAFCIGGARMNRSYSISSSPNVREYVDLTVRREPRGAISRHIVDLLKVGDLIETGGPVGKFTFNGTESDSIVLISGGVGITPMMSISRYLTELSWPGEIFFIYVCRTPEDFIFAEEIASIQLLNPHLHVAVTLTRAEADWKGARGRITKEWLLKTVPDLASRRTHLCGPPSMMDSVKTIFAELGIAPDHLKTEAFGAVKPVPSASGATKPTGPATGPLVTFSKNNKSAKTHLDLQTGDSPPIQSILELSEELSIGIEFSCRVGTCGLCKVKMTSGEVDQEVQDALDDDDKANGMILACQAKPKSDVTVEA